MRRKPSRLTTGRLQLLRLFSTLLAIEALTDNGVRFVSWVLSSCQFQWWNRTSTGDRVINVSPGWSPNASRSPFSQHSSRPQQVYDNIDKEQPLANIVKLGEDASSSCGIAREP